MNTETGLKMESRAFKSITSDLNKHFASSFAGVHHIICQEKKHFHNI